ncbi:MAG: ROK family protein, partial [bacterium]|nr:ROK family protein [bacterium]
MEIVLDGPVLAVDIGGTKVAVGMVAPNGQVLCQRRGPSQAADGEALFALIVELAREVLEEHSQPVSVCGVGSG